MVHSACTVHLLNLPEKTAKRDIIHGVKHLEEIAEDWLCARRTLSILSVLSRKWKIELPEEASTVLARTDAKYGTFSTADVPSPPKTERSASPPNSIPTSSPKLQVHSPQQAQNQYHITQDFKYVTDALSMASTAPLSDGIIASTIGMAQSTQSIINPITSPRSNGTVQLPPDNTMPLGGPYSQHHQYNSMPDPLPSSLGPQQTPSCKTSSAPSPSKMFGGVDALVESQNWWLRDQASMAVEFDNWGLMDGADLSGMSGPGMNGDFFMPGNGNGNLNGGLYGDDESYN